MTPIIITLSLLIPSKQGRINSGMDLGKEVRFVVFIPDHPRMTSFSDPDLQVKEKL